MPPKSSLPKEIQKRPFTWNEAKELGVSWNDIQRQLKSGKIERISHGVYRVPADDLDEEEQFRIATLRIGEDSVVCLLSALAYYGLTDAIPRTVWLLVPAERHTRFSGVRLFRKRTPRLDVGIVLEDGYRITSLERTLAESLAEGKRIGVNTGVQALRKALSQKKTTLSKVMNSAIELGVSKKILPYIEALS
jgi:predicted transcriptional regulator of viral defense system